MITGRVVSALAAVALVGAASIAAAPAASADQTWHQGIGRASADAVCPTTSEEEADAGWSEWQASWDQWPNSDAGGFVCSRSNTWLHESTEDGPIDYPKGACVRMVNTWVNFKGGWSLPVGSPWYNSSSCTKKTGYTSKVLVYAPAGSALATRLCLEAFHIASKVTPTTANEGAYWCDYSPK